MKDFSKNKLTTIIIVVATIVLAGIAIFTAVRLFQLRQESISPARPESAPEATANDYQSCSALVFTLSETPPPGEVICDLKEAYRDDPNNTAGNYTLTDQIVPADGDTIDPGEIIVYVVQPSPVGQEWTMEDVLSEKVGFLDADTGCSFDSTTSTITCTGTPDQFAYRVQIRGNATGTVSNTALVNGYVSPTGSCSIDLTILSDEPTPTPTATPTLPPGATATPTATPTAPPGEPTPTPTATPTGSAIAQVTPGPTDQPALPEAGIATPTIIGTTIALILLILSFALAL